MTAHVRAADAGMAGSKNAGGQAKPAKMIVSGFQRQIFPAFRP